MTKTDNGVARPKRGKGRPTQYCRDVADRICTLLAEGMTLNATCRMLAKEIPNLPARPTILAWANDPEHPFSEKYARARMLGYQLMADELIDIADAHVGLGKTAADSGVVQRDRLRVETRKWLLAKALPRVYGDRSEVNLSASQTLHFSSVTVAETRRWLESLHEPATHIEGLKSLPD
jgi:hypothetical protein